MQATLQQAAPPPPDSVVPNPSVVKPLWAAQPWFMAAAATSTVLLVTFCVWQRHQINDLRQTVQQLNKQQSVASSSAKNSVEPMQRAPTASAPSSSGQKEPSASPNDVAQTGMSGQNMAQPVSPKASAVRTPAPGYQPDTVYITRYVPTPAPSNTDKANRSNQQASPFPERSETGDQLTYPGGGTQQRPVSPANAPTEQVASAPTVIRNPTNRMPDAEQTQIATVDKPTNESSAGQPTGQKNRQRGSDPRQAMTPADHESSAESIRPLTDSGRSAGQTEVSEETRRPTILYELMASRPVQVASTDWSTALLRRANRAKPVRTVTVGGQASASQPVERMATRLRLGAGTDVSKNIWSLGVLTEVTVGKHWTLNVGISRAIRSEGPFSNEEDFYVRTHRNFKKEYGRFTDPRPSIFNIKTKTVRVQLPISLGYRIPVGQRFTLLPSVGTNLNLVSNEFITFYHWTPFNGPNIDVVQGRIARQVDLINNLTFNTSVEWQQRHWAIQAGPVVTAPVQADTKWQTGLSTGLRARVLYQF